jgi:hypothetical protein
MLQKELYNAIPNVALWQVLRNRLHLNMYERALEHYFAPWCSRQVVLSAIAAVNF